MNKMERSDPFLGDLVRTIHLEEGQERQVERDGKA